MQYQSEVRTACSRLVYHMVVLGWIRRGATNSCNFTHIMMKAGWTQDSKTPSKKRTAMRDAKFFAAAEQAITQPHKNTFVARYLATGSFWRRRFVGYSPTKTPMYKIVPSQLV